MLGKSVKLGQLSRKDFSVIDWSLFFTCALCSVQERLGVGRCSCGNGLYVTDEWWAATKVNASPCAQFALHSPQFRETESNRGSDYVQSIVSIVIYYRYEFISIILKILFNTLFISYSRESQLFFVYFGKIEKYFDIADITKKFLGVSAVTVPAERGVSKAGLILTSQRNRLKANIVNLLFVSKPNCGYWTFKSKKNST